MFLAKDDWGDWSVTSRAIESIQRRLNEIPIKTIRFPILTVPGSLMLSYPVSRPQLQDPLCKTPNSVSTWCCFDVQTKMSLRWKTVVCWHHHENWVVQNLICASLVMFVIEYGEEWYVFLDMEEEIFWRLFQAITSSITSKLHQ